MPYLYILKCADNTFYVGSTKDIERRFYEHQQGLGANYTKCRLPVELAYVEEFQRIDDAYAVEKQIHSWSHQKKQALIDGDYQTLRESAKKKFIA